MYNIKSKMAIIIDKGALCICVRKSSNVILLTKEMKKGVINKPIINDGKMVLNNDLRVF